MITSIVRKTKLAVAFGLFPLALLVLIVMLGRHLDLMMVNDWDAPGTEPPAKVQHMNARPASFGVERALANQADSAEVDTH